MESTANFIKQLLVLPGESLYPIAVCYIACGLNTKRLLADNL